MMVSRAWLIVRNRLACGHERRLAWTAVGRGWLYSVTGVAVFSAVSFPGAVETTPGAARVTRPATATARCDLAHGVPGVPERVAPLPDCSPERWSDPLQVAAYFSAGESARPQPSSLRHTGSSR